MSKGSFLKQYITNPWEVGAVLPSSRYLAQQMVDDIDFKKAKVIVEYGPGTGVFTNKLLKNREKDTILLIIENNLKFYEMLVKKFEGTENMHIIYDSAENIKKHLELLNIENVDYVMSGLPFASLPKTVSDNILNVTREILSGEGKFITFQYTLLKKGFINQYFENIKIKREFRNVPPAYIFNCMNHQ